MYKVSYPPKASVLGKPLQSYVSEVLSRDSKSAARNLQSAMGGAVRFNTFEDASINLTKFDWLNGSDNRNWWWQLQQLPFVRWYVQSIKTIQDSLIQESVIEFIHKSVVQWIECAQDKGKTSPLLWHDHASTFRLRNLADLYVAMMGLGYTKHPLINTLSEQIVNHASWISLEKNYSCRTNHGFDQSDILLRTCLIFPDCQEFTSFKTLASQRLKDEINFAFTDQGVHKENSPHYQQYMISRLNSLSDYEKLGETEIIDSFFKSNNIDDALFEKASVFLKALFLPDGTLPMIGDTRGECRFNLINIPSLSHLGNGYSGSEFKILDYSKSGYVVVEYIDEQTSLDGKIIVRSGQFSHYHRHDDDLSIYWQIGDQVILGDGGLYSYNEQDPKRKFVRSPLAHNTVYVQGLKAERLPKRLKKQAKLDVASDPLRIIGSTFYFQDWQLGRVINLERLKQGILLFEDQAYSDEKSGVIAVTGL